MSVEQRFERFFSAVNGGAAPYPWQCALVSRIGATGVWPEAITAPTGAGKSSIVDVHVFLVAEWARTVREGGGAVQRPPRRLVLVAPRRVLVDDQYERALRLAEVLAAPAGRDEIVGEVSGSLAELVTARSDAPEGSDTLRALGVSRLRGGVRLDNSWRLDPAQCQIICATPQMWGSRLMLRGYRGSRGSRNLEGGLLGHDTVVVIDEAHLHEQLVATATRVASARPSAMGLQVSAMSATRDFQGAHGLTADDLAENQEELRRRVLAHKGVDLVEVEDWKRDARATIVERARAHHEGGTVGVFVNTVATALNVAADLRGDSDATVVLVCGRMRPADIDRLREDHPGLLDARGNTGVDYLVTTQSLEVGVDLDLPAMVTEVAPPAALAQRLGRLNRSGRLAESTFSIVCPAALATLEPDALGHTFAPYYAADVVAAANWLDELGGDASPQRISTVPLPVSERAPAPMLSGVDLDILAMSSGVLAADIDPSLYIEEPRAERERRVSIGARAHVGELTGTVVRQALLAAPPRAHELASIRIGKPLAAVLAVSRESWVMRTDAGVHTAAPLADPADLRDGDVVIIAAGSMAFAHGTIGRVPGAKPIADVIDRRPDGPADAVLRLPRQDIDAIVEANVKLARRATRDAVARSIDSSEGLGEAGRVAAGRLRQELLRDLNVSWCADPEAEHGLLVLQSCERDGRLPPTAVNDGEDQLVTVESHGAAVERRLEAILEALDPVDLGATRAQMLAAGRFHDEGKRHTRFQRRMGAYPETAPLAKPVPGHVPDRGDGWRHEQLSAAIASAGSDRDPVVVAVVAGHHGQGRPLFDRDHVEAIEGWAECEESAVGELARLFGPYGSYETERARLQRELGVHRLAYLEALLRCADMQISREGR